MGPRRLNRASLSSGLSSKLVYDLDMPPLNQTLWMLLVASLTALARWGGLLILKPLVGNWIRNRRKDHTMSPHGHAGLSLRSVDVNNG